MNARVAKRAGGHAAAIVDTTPIVENTVGAMAVAYQQGTGWGSQWCGCRR